jgi:hypothetical protein
MGGVWVDWIERVFGVSPDGGSGVTEALLLAAVLITVVTTVIGVRVLARRQGRND